MFFQNRVLTVAEGFMDLHAVELEESPSTFKYEYKMLILKKDVKSIWELNGLWELDVIK